MVDDPVKWYDDIADDYAAKMRGEDESHIGRLATILHRNRLEKVMGLMPTGRSLRILDFGCGSGEFLIQLAKAGHHCVGVDTSPKLIQAAREMAAREGVTVDFIVGDVRAIPDGPFDVITALSVILFLTTQEEDLLFSRAREVLSPGGFVLANFYNRLLDIATANRFTRAFFRAALDKSGFDAERTREIDRAIEDVLPQSHDAPSYQTPTMRDATIVRGRHPFHIQREVQAHGFAIERFIFTRYHLVPPHVAERPENIDLYRHQVQFWEDAETAEYGPVLASNMIIRMTPHRHSGE